MPLRKAEILFAGNEFKGTYSNAKCSGVRRLREGIPLNKNLKKLDHAYGKTTQKVERKGWNWL